MNKSFWLLLAIVFLSCKANTQTADEVINKNIEAKGGLAKIKSINSLLFVGTATNRGRILNIELMYDHLKAMRTEFSIDSNRVFTILTTKQGWRSSAKDSSGIEPLNDWEVADGQFQLDAHGVYIEYKKKGYEATYMGKDTSLGKQCDKIKLVKKGEGDKFFYFDDDHMLVKSIIQRLTAPGNYVNSVNYYLDYRKSPDGYLFSYLRKTTSETITFTSITVNAPLPDIYFKPF